MYSNIETCNLTDTEVDKLSGKISEGPNMLSGTDYIPPLKRKCQSVSTNLIYQQEPLDLASPKPCIFQSAFRLSSSNVCKEAIETILKDSLEGLGVLGEYKTNQVLAPSSRDTLTHLIINRCSLTLDGTSRFFKEISKAITALMPNESEDIYFIAPYTADNNTKNAKGKLPDRWRNVLFLLRRQNVIPKNTRKPPTHPRRSITLDGKSECI